MSALKELKIVVREGENFTPADLMRRYAALHAAAEFGYNKGSGSELKIAGDSYRYDHWSIKPEADGTETVTLYMRKVEKELYHWSMDCSWPAVDLNEHVSVLAEDLRGAKEKAKEVFQEISGAPMDEIEVSKNIFREKADLGLELYKAVKDYHGYEKAAKFIQMGADVNYRYLPDEYNFTPLHMAAYNADLLKMELLVEAGCDVNALDIEGATPLDRAIARHNYPHIVEYLEEHGAMRGLDVILEQAHARTKELVGKVVEREREMV